MLQRFVHHRRSTACRLLAVFALFLGVTAVAPCVMAQSTPAATDHAGCCTDKAAPLAENCDALSALDCRTPEPVPPSAASDLPAPAVLVHTPAALAPVAPPDKAGPLGRTELPPPPLHQNRKHSRLLI